MSKQVSGETFRRQLFDILERTRRGDLATRIFDVVLVSLILLVVAVSVAETVTRINLRFGSELERIHQVCMFLFVIEYGARIWTAPEHPVLQGKGKWKARFAQARQPMMVMDLLAVSPIFMHWIFDAHQDFVHSLFLLRFYRLTGYVPVLATIVGVVASEWRALTGIAVLFAVLLLFSGFAMYLAEGQVQPELLGDVPRAVWWSIVTVSTVGYGDVVPVTTAGRMIAGLTMIFGLVFFALPVGIIATSFQQQIRRRDFVVSFAMVARVPLFAPLDMASVARLIDLLTARRVSAGEIIFNEGDEADAMYFVNSGEVLVGMPRDPVTLSEGDFFGEMALLGDNNKRTATVIAKRSCDLLVLDAGDFQKLLMSNEEIGNAVGKVAEQRRRARDVA